MRPFRRKPYATTAPEVEAPSDAESEESEPVDDEYYEDEDVVEAVNQSYQDALVAFQNAEKQLAEVRGAWQ